MGYHHHWRGNMSRRNADKKNDFFLATLTVIFASILALNSWQIQRTANGLSLPLIDLTQEVRRLTNLLTETRITHDSRISKVERDVSVMVDKEISILRHRVKMVEKRQATVRP